MTPKLSPKQSLVIYSLLITGKEPLQSEVLPKLQPKERKQLVDAELIETFKKASGRGSYLRLTERAWSWAEENLGSPLSKSQAASETLQNLLLKLRGYLSQNDVPLRDILAPAKSGLAHTLNGDEIRSAYLKITGGNLNVPVRIAELSKSLPHLSAEHFLYTLLELNAAKQIFFARLDDPQSITEEDRRLTVRIDSDEKHLVGFIN